MGDGVRRQCGHQFGDHVHHGQQSRPHVRCGLCHVGEGLHHAGQHFADDGPVVVDVLHERAEPAGNLPGVEGAHEADEQFVAAL